MSTQNIPNLHVYSSDEIESKRKNADKRESKRVIISTCSLDDRESKDVHISDNTSGLKYAKNGSVSARKVKYAKNETKYEEPLATDNSVINAPSYFKLFKCGKNSLKKLDAICEQS